MMELQTKTINTIRALAADTVQKAKSGHPGGSLSAADMLTYLYFAELRVDPKNPKDPARDRDETHRLPVLLRSR